MITPTNGRIVWFTPPKDYTVPRQPGTPLAAIVSAVFPQDGFYTVNLLAIDAQAGLHAFENVALIEGDVRPVDGPYAEWMPYQKRQAAKAEALEAKLAATDAEVIPEPVAAEPEVEKREPELPPAATSTTAEFDDKLIEDHPELAVIPGEEEKAHETH